MPLPLTLSIPIAKVLESMYWLRDGASAPGGEYVERLLFPDLTTSVEAIGELPASLRCSLPKDNRVPAYAVVREVTQLIRHLNHPEPELFASLLVSLVAVLHTRQPDATAAMLLAALLETAAPTECWYYRVLDQRLTGPATFMSHFAFGPFWFGPLTRDEISSKIVPVCAGGQGVRDGQWCGRYAMRWRTDVQAIWPVAHFASLLGADAIREDNAWYSAANAAIQEYYVRMHMVMDRSATTSLKRMAGLCALHGSRVAHVSRFREDDPETRFTLFSTREVKTADASNKLRPMSWIVDVPRTFTPLNESMRQHVREQLQSGLQSMEAIFVEAIQKYKAPQLHPLVSRFVDRLGCAQEQLARRNLSAAFLDYVISLEILFSEKATATDAVSGRVATLLALAVNAPEGSAAATRKTEVAKEVKRLYVARSRYVHSGIEIEDVDLEALRRIVSELAPIVLRWNDTGAPEDETAHAEWLRQIDYARATIEMDRAVSPSDQYAMGVLERAPDSGSLRLMPPPSPEATS